MRRRRDLGMYVLSDAEGKPRYVYRGPSFVPPVSGERLSRVKAGLFLAAAVQAGLVFLMGKLNFPSFRALYVMLPFLLLVFAAGWGVKAAASLFFWKGKMTQREHRVSWNALGASGLLGAVSGILLAVGAAVFPLFGGGSPTREGWLLLLVAGQVGADLVFFLYIRRNPCRAEPPDSQARTDGKGRLPESE